jgi:phosphoadenosine phosphosulfate reductase
VNLELHIADARERLRAAVDAHAPATFASSLGAEDMVILDLLHRLALDVEVFTLDTGRLPEETHALLAEARQRYARPIRVLYPDATALEAFVAEHGSNAFYQSIALRQRCCELRKLEPLRRALQGKRLWITGLRREQSLTRAAVAVLAQDSTNGLLKLNPLADWTSADVWAYVERFDVPTNALHRRGYPSIGCAPCTRAVAPGEDERAGRWWWERPESRECGLHMDPQGRLVRARPATELPRSAP